LPRFWYVLVRAAGFSVRVREAAFSKAGIDLPWIRNDFEDDFGVFFVGFGTRFERFCGIPRAIPFWLKQVMLNDVLGRFFSGALLDSHLGTIFTSFSGSVFSGDWHPVFGPLL
jgi:hypothetical protein